MSAGRGDLSDFVQQRTQDWTADPEWDLDPLWELDELLYLVRSGLVRVDTVEDENGRVGLVIEWDETEVDRRLGLLGRAGVDPAVLAELRSFHETRRQREQQLKEVRQNGEKEESDTEEGPGL